MASATADSKPQPTTTTTVITDGSETDEKAIKEVTSYPAANSDKHGDFPLKWKIVALICGVALSWGSSLSENTLGPLKSTLRKELDITNAQVSITR